MLVLVPNTKVPVIWQELKPGIAAGLTRGVTATDELLLKAIELLGYVRGLSKELRLKISDQISQGKLREAVEVILETYYDPLYSRHFVDEPLLRVDGSDLDKAAEQILALLSA